MQKIQYRVESGHPIICPFLASGNLHELLFADRSMAIVVAAKSQTLPAGHEIRVVNTISGEVVYKKSEGEIFAHHDD